MASRKYQIFVSKDFARIVVVSRTNVISGEAVLEKHGLKSKDFKLVGKKYFKGLPKIQVFIDRSKHYKYDQNL